MDETFLIFNNLNWHVNTCQGNKIGFSRGSVLKLIIECVLNGFHSCLIAESLISMQAISFGWSNFHLF